MPKVSEEHRLARQEEILDAARRAFRRKGFQATSMAEIITESGLSAGAIYGHFAAKTDIVRAVATSIVSARIDDLEHLGELDPMPQPSAVVGQLIESFMMATGWPAVLIQVWAESVTDPELHAVANEVFSRVRNAFVAYLTRWHQHKHGRTEAEARRIAVEQTPLLLSAIHGFVVQDTLFPDFRRQDYLDKTLGYLPV